MTTLCEQCGSASRDNAGFCRGCGAPPGGAKGKTSETGKPGPRSMESTHVTDPSFRSLNFGQMKEKTTRNAIVMTLLLGPVGLFYCTVIGGLVMTVLSILAMALGNLWASSIVWVASIVWAWWETRD